MGAVRACVCAREVRGRKDRVKVHSGQHAKNKSHCSETLHNVRTHGTECAGPIINHFSLSECVSLYVWRCISTKPLATVLCNPVTLGHRKKKNQLPASSPAGWLSSTTTTTAKHAISIGAAAAATDGHIANRLFFLYFRRPLSSISN